MDISFYNKFINIFLQDVKEVKFRKNNFFLFYKLKKEKNLDTEIILLLMKNFGKKFIIKDFLFYIEQYNLSKNEIYNLVSFYKDIKKETKNRRIKHIKGIIEELIKLSREFNVDINIIIKLYFKDKFYKIRYILEFYEKNGRDINILNAFLKVENFDDLKKLLEISKKYDFYFYDIIMFYNRFNFKELENLLEIMKKRNIDIKEDILKDNNIRYVSDIKELLFITEYFNEDFNRVKKLYKELGKTKMVIVVLKIEKEFGLQYREILDLYNNIFKEFDEDNFISFYKMFKFKEIYNVDMKFLKEFFEKVYYNFDFIDFLIDNKDKYKITIEDCINLANLLIKENILRHKYVKIEESLLEGKLKEI